jgi:ABC-type multidrug transport system permease subunit
MENLLAMPVRPIEVMLAKIVPYIFVGYVQVALILIISIFFFQLPIRGSVPLLLLALGLFIAGNLALGITFSTLSANQMQALQFAQFTLSHPYSCRASCSRSRACQSGRNGLAKSSPRPMR